MNAPPMKEKFPKRNGSSNAETKQEEIRRIHDGHPRASRVFNRRSHLDKLKRASETRSTYITNAARENNRFNAGGGAAVVMARAHLEKKTERFIITRGS